MSTIEHLEDPIKRYWRPTAAYLYLLICLFDFVLAPIYIHHTTILLTETQQHDFTKEWKPLTLEGGGLFHLSFGAIIGVAAWTRGQEKLSAINKG